MATLDEKIEKTDGTGKKSRFFACVSYIPNTDELIEILQTKGKSIRSFALIKHDKEEGELHHHIVIRTHTNWKCLQVAKWFKSPTGQNTFVQPVRDRQGILDYLTHENAPEKYQYDKSDIIDGGLDDLLPACESSDESYEIVEMLIKKTSIRELVRLYGKDFIYHYGSYVAVANAIKEEEGENDR